MIVLTFDQRQLTHVNTRCCPVCRSEDLRLVIADDEWRQDGDDADPLPVNAEVTAHICVRCLTVVSIAVNIL